MFVWRTIVWIISFGHWLAHWMAQSNGIIWRNRFRPTYPNYARSTRKPPSIDAIHSYWLSADDDGDNKQKRISRMHRQMANCISVLNGCCDAKCVVVHLKSHPWFVLIYNFISLFKWMTMVPIALPIEFNGISWRMSSLSRWPDANETETRKCVSCVDGLWLCDRVCRWIPSAVTRF